MPNVILDPTLALIRAQFGFRIQVRAECGKKIGSEIKINGSITKIQFWCKIMFWLVETASEGTPCWVPSLVRLAQLVYSSVPLQAKLVLKLECAEIALNHDMI